MKSPLSYIFITILILSSVLSLNAQYYPDATFATSEYISTLNTNLDEENATYFDTTYNNLNVNLSVDIHIVKNDTGQINFSTPLLDDCFLILNEYFAPIGLAFSIGNIEIINEWEYAYLNDESTDEELIKKYASPNKIDVFLVETIERGEEVPFYGYTHFPNDIKNTSIVLRKSCMTGKNLTTQMGHFFGLLSTHESLGGFGTVDTANCNRNGDYLCDTYADPGLYGTVNIACLYEGVPPQDPNGELYVPSVANLMSDSPESCKCLFTMDQFRRMYFYYNKYRHNLLAK